MTENTKFTESISSETKTTLSDTTTQNKGKIPFEIHIHKQDKEYQLRLFYSICSKGQSSHESIKYIFEYIINNLDFTKEEYIKGLIFGQHNLNVIETLIKKIYDVVIPTIYIVRFHNNNFCCVIDMFLEEYDLIEDYYLYYNKDHNFYLECCDFCKNKINRENNLVDKPYIF